nr:fbd-associated f-box protein [Quercus suber]
MLHSLKLPSSISFSCLKRLTLEKVIFSDDHSTQQLFTGCPILEDLCLIDCIWKYVKAVCISSPMLRRLFISDRYLFTEKYGENDDKDDLNADADENDSNGSQVVILGTSLKWFAFDGELINDCCFCNSSSVVDASIEAFERNEVDCYQDAHRVFKLLSGLSSVEKLVILMVLNHAEELFAHLPVFYKLTRLSLESLETLFTCGAVQTILQNSPCLDFLEFQMAVCISSPMLRRLFISDRYLFTEKYGENDDKDDLNADADENDSNGSQVVILGTSLKWFAFDGELINDCCFCNSSSVVDASIEAFERNEVDCYQDAHRVFKLLSGLSSVEKLVILMVLNHAEELFAHLPVFYKLTRLSLESLETLFTCGAVQTILQNSPCLDFLEFQMVVCLPAYDQNYDWVLDPVPACFVTHLKTIKISEFPRDENEMNAVNIFLENASVLERIVIGCDEYVAIQREEGELKEAKGIL